MYAWLQAWTSHQKRCALRHVHLPFPDTCPKTYRTSCRIQRRDFDVRWNLWRIHTLGSCFLDYLRPVHLACPILGRRWCWRCWWRRLLRLCSSKAVRLTTSSPFYMYSILNLDYYALRLVLHCIIKRNVSLDRRGSWIGVETDEAFKVPQ